MEDLFHEATDQDRENLSTCKRPSVKSMIFLLENYSKLCIPIDVNDYPSISYSQYIHNKCSEIQSIFMEAWDHYYQRAWGKDSWNPLPGTGVNDKNGIKHMIYNNLDSVYLLGTKEQHDITTLATVNNTDPPEGFVNVFEFITDGIGGLMSDIYLTNDKNVLNKTKQAGEIMLKVYEKWYPYTFYDFTNNIGKYEKVPIKAIFNVAEIYMLYSYTGDSRYKVLLENISLEAKQLLRFDVLPEYAIFKDDKIMFEGVITNGHSSGEFQRILYNNWILSNKTSTVYKELYDKNKNYSLKKLPFSNDKGDVLMMERNGNEIEYRMNIKMCSWPGILAQENFFEPNLTEVRFAQKLMKSCIKFFTDKTLPNNYLYLEKEMLVQGNKTTTIPGEIFESIYYLHRLTRDKEYRNFMSQALQTIRTVAKVNYGYTVPGTDKMPKDFFSKTLKFIFLTYNEDKRLALPTTTPSGHILGYY